ncbi:Cytochrome P450 monooxygenase CLM2 [Paramyrothecium foliicola]|nr:Cytochrome P450 monooxygenase CLM2 [Paramyrothecium foliicola]
MVGVILPDQESDESSDDFESSKDEDAKEESNDAETKEQPSPDQVLRELMQDPHYRQSVFNSYCITNDLPGVGPLLETYKHDPFVSRRDNHGVNFVVLAAVEGHDEIIRFLHVNHDDLNNVDSRGRTPLMEAALWGRLKVGEFLLQHSADLYAKDHQGRTAYVYSRPSKHTARMRDKFDRYQESREAENNRRVIAIRLQEFEDVTETEEASVPIEIKCGRFIIEDTDHTIISFYKQNRGTMFSIVSAASGWRTDFSVEHVLKNRLWRDHVLELCQLIRHTLPQYRWDEAGLSGSYSASHAEKKLIAYYVNEHVVLPCNILECAGFKGTGMWRQQDLELQHLVPVASKQTRFDDADFDCRVWEAAAIILNIVYGYSIEPDKLDPLTNLVQLMMDNFSRAFVPMAWSVDVLPALNYLPEGFPLTSFKRIGRQWKRINEIVIDAPYLFVRDQMMQRQNRPSYVSSLVDSLSSSDNGAARLSKDDEDGIKVTAAALYGGGADTTVSSISSFVLAMMLFPAVQKKAQKEINDVVGNARLPDSNDQARLPYINALVKEALRWFPVVPIATAHATSTEILYDGYRIPKGSYILSSIWWFLHDPDVYADPSSFDPERYFESRNEPDPSEHVFGYGRRICPGRYLAVESLFITISRILAAFDISKAVDDNGKVIEPELKATSGLVSHPATFPFTIKPRSVRHEELIRAVEVEHPWDLSDSKNLDHDLIAESISLSTGHNNTHD